jgi:hypothetical protein
MRWIRLIFVFAVTYAVYWALPYLATIGWTLMGWTGWTLLQGSLIALYLRFIGPQWGKALRPFRSNPDLPLFPPMPEGYKPPGRQRSTL